MAGDQLRHRRLAVDQPQQLTLVVGQRRLPSLQRGLSFRCLVEDRVHVHRYPCMSKATMLTVSLSYATAHEAFAAHGSDRRMALRFPVSSTQHLPERMQKLHAAW